MKANTSTHERTPVVRHGLTALAAHRWFGWCAVVGLAAGAALATSIGMPRGPITSGHSLMAMVGGFLVGAAAGLISGTRWAMLAGPAAYVLTIELARLGADAPSTGPIHLDTPVGLVAFVTGRGFHGLVALVPMILGAAVGAGAARRWGAPDPTPARRSAGQYARLAVTAATAVALIALGVIIARPARTPAIAGPDGRPLPGSVAELTTVALGGHDQSVLIRGVSVDNPVLLYLAGGPGGTDLGAMRLFGERLEQEFVVATWDQRGAGKSYRALDPASTLTVERMVADAIELTNYLRDRFDEQRVYLVGNSWGTILGVLAVQQRPDLFHAFIGTGQMVSVRETDRMFYEDTIAWAERIGDTALARRLREQGPPPYREPWRYAALLSYERQWNDYPRDPEYDAKGEMPFNVFVGEYTFVEQVHAFNAFLDTAAVLYPNFKRLTCAVPRSSWRFPSMSSPDAMRLGAARCWRWSGSTFSRHRPSN